MAFPVQLMLTDDSGSLSDNGYLVVNSMHICLVYVCNGVLVLFLCVYLQPINIEIPHPFQRTKVRKNKRFLYNVSITKIFYHNQLQNWLSKSAAFKKEHLIKQSRKAKRISRCQHHLLNRSAFQLILCTSVC